MVGVAACILYNQLIAWRMFPSFKLSQCKHAWWDIQLEGEKASSGLCAKSCCKVLWDCCGSWRMIWYNCLGPGALEHIMNQNYVQLITSIKARGKVLPSAKSRTHDLKKCDFHNWGEMWNINKLFTK